MPSPDVRETTPAATTDTPPAVDGGAGSTAAPDGAVTVAEAAGFLGLSPSRVRQLARDGRLEVVGTAPLRLSGRSLARHRDERGGPAHADDGPAPPVPAQGAPPLMHWDGRARRWVPPR
ncbi:helix-turn-helix domain-containing protein [Kineococcus glutinatus]|uniref:helix-turn-helix domain-containing protein n=1 Tax=Kineococcus glutinatus TaxID=1070872 RepID=UPI0031E735D3